MSSLRAFGAVLVAGVACAAAFVAASPASAVVTGGKPRPTAGSDACGTQPLKPDGSAWRCTFVDDFGGKSLDRTKWLPQTAFATGDAAGAFACYLDDPSTVKVSGGSLQLTLRRASAPASCRTANGIQSTNYVSGMVTSYHLFSQQYGRFEARVRTTATAYPGLHEAFWLWPDDRVSSTAVWPESGEMDVSETYSVHPNLSIPFLHYSADAQGPQPGLNTAYDCTAARGTWNTYTLEWAPGRIEIRVNGRSCLVNTSGDAAFQKPYIVAFTQALGVGDNAYDGRAPLPATLGVDYLRVWS